MNVSKCRVLWNVSVWVLLFYRVINTQSYSRDWLPINDKKVSSSKVKSCILVFPPSCCWSIIIEGNMCPFRGFSINIPNNQPYPKLRLLKKNWYSYVLSKNFKISSEEQRKLNLSSESPCRPLLPSHHPCVSPTASNKARSYAGRLRVKACFPQHRFHIRLIYRHWSYSGKCWKRNKEEHRKRRQGWYLSRLV